MVHIAEKFCSKLKEKQVSITDDEVSKPVSLELSVN